MEIKLPIVHRTTLPDGGDVTLALVFDAGSVQEGRGERGLAHVVEHMVFKRTACVGEGDIAKISASRGARFNAWTGFDTIGFYFECRPSDAALFAHLLVDMCFGAQFDDTHLRRELLAVADEMNRRENALSAEIWAALRDLAGIGRLIDHDPIGDLGDLCALNAARLHAFMKQTMRPDRCAWVVAGGESELPSDSDLLGLLPDSVQEPSRQSAREFIKHSMPSTSISPSSLHSSPFLRLPSLSVVNVPHMVAAWMVPLLPGQKAFLDDAATLAAAAISQGECTEVLKDEALSRVTLAVDCVMPDRCMVMLHADCMGDPTWLHQEAMRSSVSRLREPAQSQLPQMQDAWRLGRRVHRAHLRQSSSEVVQLAAGGVLDALAYSEMPMPSLLSEPKDEACLKLASALLDGVSDVHRLIIFEKGSPLDSRPFDWHVGLMAKASEAASRMPVSPLTGGQCDWLSKDKAVGQPINFGLPAADAGQVAVKVLHAPGWSVWHSPDAWKFEFVTSIVMRACDLPLHLARKSHTLGVEHTGMLVLGAWGVEGGSDVSLLTGHDTAKCVQSVGQGLSSLRAQERVYAESVMGCAMHAALKAVWGRVILDAYEFLKGVNAQGVLRMWHDTLGRLSDPARRGELTPVKHPGFVAGTGCARLRGKGKGASGCVVLAIDLGFEVQSELDIVTAGAAQTALFGGMDSIILQLREKKGLFYGVTGFGAGSVSQCPPSGVRAVTIVQTTCAPANTEACASSMAASIPSHLDPSVLLGQVRQSMAVDMRAAHRSSEQRAALDAQLTCSGWDPAIFRQVFNDVLLGKSTLRSVKPRVCCVSTAVPS